MFIFQKDQARPKDIYLASPNNQIIGLLDGVTSARLTPRFNDIWELNVVVDRYVDEVPSQQYDHILQYMELHIPEIGWFRINQLPKKLLRVTAEFIRHLPRKDMNAFYRMRMSPAFMLTLVTNCPMNFSLKTQ